MRELHSPSPTKLPVARAEKQKQGIRMERHDDGEEESHDLHTTTIESNENEVVVFFAERDETFLLIHRLLDDDQEGMKDAHKALARITAIFYKYLECPTLLDGSLEDLVVLLGEKWLERRSRLLLNVMYTITVVRGRKVVQRFLPHALSTVGPVWDGLQQCYRESNTQGDDLEESLLKDDWKSVYCLWIWMGVVSRIPFHSHLVLDATGCSQLLELAQRALCDTGPVREAAAITLASWLVRPDWEEHRLPQWIDWAHSILQPNEQGSRGAELFVRLGSLQVIVALLKISTADRERLSEQLQSLSQTLHRLTITAKDRPESSSKLMDHYLVKWWTRWSCWHLPPPIQRRRPQQCLYSNESKRTMAENAAATRTKINTGPSPELNSEKNLWEIPPFVEDAMDHLIRSLSHSATSVRWAAAKGIGRIASRLPLVAVEDVVEAVLSSPPDHGSCLALAELARRQLIQDPSRISLQQQLRHPSPVVRDAACYVYWALCRAYPPTILAPLLPAWNAAMVVTALLDREVNCRRAAAAAFQEAVGRQGARNVPNGLAILTSADYFSLGNRTNAYTVVAVSVAALSELYRRAILRQLYTVQLFHADVAIRTLASNALYHLTHLDTEYIATTVIPNLVSKCYDADVKIRHGSILAIAESMQALSDAALVVSNILSTSLIQRIVELIPEIEKRRLYRGRGGEYVRLAACRLVESMVQCHISLAVKDQVRLLDSIDGHIPHPNEDIQRKACAALFALLNEYFPVGISGPSDRLQKRVVDRFIGQASSSTNPSATRGYCLALGHIPAKLIAPNDTVLSDVIGCLCRISQPAALVGKEGDAETRRNALQSLTTIIDTVGFVQQSTGNVSLNALHVEGIAKAFLRSLDDYKTDRRGDVGSWCRIEAMTGIVHLVMVSTKEACPVAEPMVTSAVQKILRQLVEKLDVVRLKAGASLEELLLADSVWFSGKQELLGALGSFESVDWRNTEIAFSRSIRAVTIPTYRRSIISGFSASIGGLTEQVSIRSSETLVSWIRACDAEERHAIGICFVDILRGMAGRRSRLILPMLKTLDVVFTNGCYSGNSDEMPGFLQSCLEAIASLMVDSTVVPHLLASIDVYTAIVGVTANEVSRTTGLAFLCRLLMHPYPRVRSYAADHMLLLDCVGPALDLLVETHWVSDVSSDDNDRQDVVRKIAEALHISLPPHET